MTALNFPASPVVGQVFGRWVWSGATWVLIGSGESRVPGTVIHRVRLALQSSALSAGRIRMNSTNQTFISFVDIFPTDADGNDLLPVLRALQPGDLMTLTSVNQPNLFTTFRTATVFAPSPQNVGPWRANLALGSAAGTGTTWPNGSVVDVEFVVGTGPAVFMDPPPMMRTGSSWIFPKAITVATFGITQLITNRPDVFEAAAPGTNSAIRVPAGRYMALMSGVVQPNPNTNNPQPWDARVEVVLRSVPAGQPQATNSASLATAAATATLSRVPLITEAATLSLREPTDLFVTLWDTAANGGWTINGAMGIRIDRISD